MVICGDSCQMQTAYLFENKDTSLLYIYIFNAVTVYKGLEVRAGFPDL